MRTCACNVVRLNTFVLLAITLATSSLASPHKWERGDPCPTLIEAIIPGDCQHDKDDKLPHVRFDTMASVHSALTTCPNITSLDLRVALRGCANWPDRWSLPFNPDGSDKFPNLTSLRLEGYPFNGRDRERWQVPKNVLGYMDWMADLMYWVCRGDVFEWVTVKRLDEQQRNKSHLDLWLDAMDWGQLEELIIDHSITDEVLAKVPPRLKALKSLKTTSLPLITAFEDNILKDLTWIGRFEKDTLPTIVQHQGQSLESLVLRCDELECEHTPIDKEQLAILVEGTTKLTHLSTNIHRNGTWPLEVFSTLSSIHSIKTLDLWFNIQSTCRRQKPEKSSEVAYKEWQQVFGKGRCEGQTQYQQPFIWEHSARKLFKQMREEKVGEELERVTFWAGDWTRSCDGLNHRDSFWPKAKCAKVVCATIGKEVGEKWCVVEYGYLYWLQDERISFIDMLR